MVWPPFVNYAQVKAYTFTEVFTKEVSKLAIQYAFCARLAVLKIRIRKCKRSIYTRLIVIYCINVFTQYTYVCSAHHIAGSDTSLYHMFTLIIHHTSVCQSYLCPRISSPV